MLRHTVWGAKFRQHRGSWLQLAGWSWDTKWLSQKCCKNFHFQRKKCLFVIFFAYRNTNKVVSPFSRSPTHVSNNVHKISYACRANYYRIRQCTQKGAHYMYIKLVCSLTKEITAKFSFKIKQRTSFMHLKYQNCTYFS